MSEQISNWDVFEAGVVHTLGFLGKHKRPFLGALALVLGLGGTIALVGGQGESTAQPSSIQPAKSEIDLAIERAQLLLTTPGLFGNDRSFVEEMNAQGYSLSWKPIFGRTGIIRTGSVAQWGLIDRQVPSTDAKYSENGRIWAGECVTWVTELAVLDNRQKSVQGESYGLTLDSHFFRLSTIENGRQPGAEGWYINTDDARCNKRLADGSTYYSRGVIGPSLFDQVLVNGPK